MGNAPCAAPNMKPELKDWLRTMRFWADAEQEASLDAFEDALYEANATRNLTRVPREEFWVRHVADSLLFQDLIPKGARVLDIGTGPGFPAWPLAWARPDLKITALDSSGKMLGFLRSHPLPNLEIVLERAEDWGIRERFDVVTGRAVAPLAIQLELSAAPCRERGRVIPMRTPADVAQLDSDDFAELGLKLEQVVRRRLAPIGAERAFPIYRKVAPTPKQYPRSWTETRAKPLDRR